MPYATTWYCGWCRKGPMSIDLDEHCCYCYRQKDTYATYDAGTSSRNMPQTFEYATEPVSLSSCGSPPNSPVYASSNKGHGYPLQTSTATTLVCNSSPMPSNFQTEYWYCCHCKDGPKLIVNQSSCVCCGHTYCSYCNFC